MPEYPDVTVYIEALEKRIEGALLERIRIAHPFLLRTYAPSPGDAESRRVVGLRRIGKQIVIALEGDLFLVIHLMIAGRFRWEARGAAVPRKLGLAAFDFSPVGAAASRPAASGAPSGAPPGGAPSAGGGTLILTEAGTKKRASLHIVQGEASLAVFDRGGLEVLDTGVDELRSALARENHTLKRALTDPRIIAGIGNAYSDEILHAARLSPFKQTRSLEEGELVRLHQAIRELLTKWAELLRREAGDRFPEGVTAFRKEMAVHGKYGKPCPVCAIPVQRIVYAENECNYCPSCQTGGKLLADRSLSRLLGSDWPSTLAELEELRDATRRSGQP